MSDAAPSGTLRAQPDEVAGEILRPSFSRGFPLPTGHPLDAPSGPPVRAEAGLHVSWLSIDGFGALSGLEISGIEAGLTVILGPNEIGKSTLFDFVAAVLFGFPARRGGDRRRFREPVRGGPHGGRIGLADGCGQTLVVERHSSPGKRLVVTCPDGSAGDEHDLRRALGGADAELFRTVFAVDLDDLGRGEAMSSDEVREVLFSSSILGQRRSATTAIRQLDARREALVKLRGQALANISARELKEAQRDLADARRAARSFAGLQAEAQRTRQQLDEHRAEKRELVARDRDLSSLLAAWEALLARRQAESRIEALPPLSPEDDRMLRAAPRLDELRVQLSGHLERRARYEAGLRGRLPKLRASVDDRVRRLGGEWARELADEPELHVEALMREARDLVEVVTGADAHVKAARALLAKARQEADQSRLVYGKSSESPAPEVVPEARQLDRRLQVLRELRVRVTEMDVLQRDVERDVEAELRDRAAGDAQQTSGRATTVLCLLAAAAMVVVAAVLLSRHETAVGVIVGAAAIACAAAGWMAHWGSGSKGRGAGGRGASGWATTGGRATGWAAKDPGDQNETSDSEGAGAFCKDSGAAETARRLRAERLERLERARGEARATALSVGISSVPSLLSIQHEIDETESLVKERDRLDRATEAVLHAESRALHAERELESHELRLSEENARVESFARRLGLPPEVGADELPDTIRHIGELRERLSSLVSLERELDESKRQIDDFEASTAAFAHSVGLSLPGDDGGGIDLETFFATSADRMENLKAQVFELQSNLDKAAAAKREIDRTLGEGERAEELRRTLESGLVLEWQSESKATEERLDELEVMVDQLVRDHAGKLRDLEQLAEASDVPRLEQRCEEIDSALRSALREYLVLSGARYLIDRTLTSYERQRQPAVLERAGDHFARVTRGAYAGVVVDPGGEGSKPTIRATRRNGEAIDGTALSRGTMEQLYLCLRIALAESFAERYVPLPIVLDDVLVNFDPERAAAVVEELAATAQCHQVLLFTCHPHLAELVSARAPQAAIQELPPT